MPTPHRLSAAFFLALCCPIFLGGCLLPKKKAGLREQDYAFISYRPPNESGGVRVAVKDLIDMKGEVTSAGSEFFAKTRPPATRDADCIVPVRRQGVQFVGKTNLSEMAITVSGINDYFGTPVNRMSKRRLIPGGSSNGSAIAVANGFADIAIGTDTAGSIRIPAACCGIAGLKTTHGLISLRGVYPVAPDHLDTVGPMAKDISGLATGMRLLRPGFSEGGAGRRVGRLYLAGTDPRIDQAVDRALQKGGFKVVRLPKELEERWKQADADARIVSSANAWLRNRQYLGNAEVSTRTKAVITLGRVEYPDRYREALQRRLKWKAALRDVFQGVDFIALPTMQQLPPRLPSRLPLIGGSAPFEALVYGLQNTAAVNLAGNPALALPIPVDDRAIPYTSLQLVGRPRSEGALLAAGRRIETALR